MRIAFFPDSFLEINGVAMTSRKLVGYAKQNGDPFLCVHAGEKTDFSEDANIFYLSLKRSPVSFALDETLKFDPLFNRHLGLVKKKLTQFQPDVIHWTGLNDVGILAAILAFQLNIPTVGSWHTNLHEYAARRLTRTFGFLKAGAIDRKIENGILKGAILYYRMPKLILAPNQELLDILTEGSGRAGQLMERGVDTEMFKPRIKEFPDKTFRLGFVGRLRAEKNVRLLAELEKSLIQAGKTNYEFVIVGEGNEREWLEKNVQKAVFTGFLEGEKLADAFAGMDVFIFPSETETFGNVVQEANAAGVPAIVTNKGGPKFIVQHGETGFIAENFEDFARFTLRLMNDEEKLASMKRSSREFALSRSWEAVFSKVYDGYAAAVDIWKAENKSNSRK